MQEFDRLVEIMARLRGPGGCPWDCQQSHASIRQYVIEEAYEVAEAIELSDRRELCGELGDLLLQIVFHAQMASEAGEFRIQDVCTAIAHKLERRHPHVFGGVKVRDADEVATNWEAIKARERGPDASAIDGVPRSLPALQRAERIGEKASRVGFDWPSAAEALQKLVEEHGELEGAISRGTPDAVQHELGDLLFAAANVARKLGIEPETALRHALDRFEVRFRHVEQATRAAGQSMLEAGPELLDRRWQDAKLATQKPATPLASKPADG